MRIENVQYHNDKLGIQVAIKATIDDREMFVDKSRGISVVMGEIDNKKAMDKRKKALIKEGLKYGTNCNEEEVDLNWEHYYLKVKFLY